MPLGAGSGLEVVDVFGSGNEDSERLTADGFGLAAFAGLTNTARAEVIGAALAATGPSFWAAGGDNDAREGSVSGGGATGLGSWLLAVVGPSAAAGASCWGVFSS